jgi:hypothetical protein
MKNTLLVFLFFLGENIYAQGIQNGQLSGNFQSDFQLYVEDDALNFNLDNPSSGFPNERGLSNGFANILYRTDNFSAGIRYEAYQNALLGYPSGYQGEEITYRFVQFDKDGLEITVGNFYEQFGSGMILRAYEERNLGYDNAFDGIRIQYSPVNGIYLKSLVGRQRIFFEKSEGLIRGLDGEISLNESFSSLSESTTRITLGSSFVSKYQTDLNTQYVLPENVASWSSRLNLNHGKWQFGAEYVHKYNDPSSANNYIFKSGNALLLSGAYSKRGFGISLAAKRIDNMDFRSERDQNLQNAIINYLPALTKQHAYTLATIYPYGTITTGEMGLQTELNYKFKKGSSLGGKYGMGLIANFSNVYAIDKQSLDEFTPIGTNGTLGYTSDFFKVGEDKYFQEFSLELSKKINRKLKFTGTYINTEYNSSVIVGYKYFGMIYADIFVFETQYKMKPKHTLRGEVQHLKTDQHEGNWAMVLIEYTVSPKYFITLQNMYNYGNKETKLNYPNLTFGFNKGTSRVAIGYGKQRAGIFCVGGICRNVPASNGLSLNITSSF